MADTRQEEIIRILERTYPGAKIALTYGSPWELLVAVILSAQCTDVMVNKVTARLFAKYKTVSDYIVTSPVNLEAAIRSTGFFRAKARNIKFCAERIHSVYGDRIPQTMEDMLTLPGVARKTANVVLGNAFGIVVGVAVDTHVLRISQRLRLVDPDTVGGKKKVTFDKKNGVTVLDYYKDADPIKTEQQLMGRIPKDNWFRLTYLLIDHGRAVCKAANPKCTACPLRHLCPASRA